MSGEKNCSGADQKKGADGNRSLSQIAPFAVLLVTECLFWFLKSKAIVLTGPVIPMSFGQIKDVLDVFVVAIFPWHGWVSALPLLAAIFVRADARKLILLFLLSSIATGLIGTYFGFREFSTQKFAVGTLTFAVINFFIFFTLLTVKFIFEGIGKCLR